MKPPRKNNNDTKKQPKPSATATLGQPSFTSPPLVGMGSTPSVTVTQQIVAEHFTGPLPPPQALAQYNEIIPGLAERIVAMAEEEAKHRRSIEHKVVDNTFQEGKRGQHYGLAIGIVAILAGAVVAIAGHPTAGSIIGGGGVVGLVSVFVVGRFFQYKQQEEPKEKNAKLG